MAKKSSKKIKSVNAKSTDTPKKKGVASMTKAEKAELIDETLETLEACEDSSEKVKLRAKLRSLGHKGGLGRKSSPKAEPKVKTKSKKKKVKTKKSKK